MSDARENFSKMLTATLQFYDISRSPKTKVDYLPNSITIEPTNLCNLRCLHCHHADLNHPSGKTGGFMDMRTYRKVINEIRRWASHITLNLHGEPLLHKNILDMIRYAKDADLFVSLLTNGTRLKSEVSRALVDAHLERIVFSFEGSCPATHEKVRYGSNFKKTLGNILYFMVHNRKCGNPPTFICMSMVDSKYTHGDCEAYKEYFNKLPINTVFINKMLNFAGTTPLGREIAVSNRANVPFDEQPTCRLPWEMMSVCWNGSVSACPLDHTETHIIGDAAIETLESIWNGERMQKFRQCHIDRDFTWIEGQGTLCCGCNARLDDPEYDLSNARTFVVERIIRQAQVYGQQLFTSSTTIDEDRDAAERKLAFAEEEMRKYSL
jgi:MoaA/NifB/PqqE/SkfB family radical SAM enzyme